MGDRVAIVTGAGQGLGLAYAEALAKEGARVVIAEIDGDRADAAASGIRAAGGRALGIQTDVADRSSCDAMVAAAVGEFGTVDVLVNNAAIYDGLRMTTFEDLDETEWDRVLSVNVKGVWQASRAVIPAMRRQGRGRIVNIASTTAVLGSTAMIHYTASKGAVIALTRAMAKALGKDNILVTGISPGLTFTDATRGILPTPEYETAVIGAQALAEGLQPQDVVPLLVFLCSDDSRFVVGQNYVIDGGMVMP